MLSSFKYQVEPSRWFVLGLVSCLMGIPTTAARGIEPASEKSLVAWGWDTSTPTRVQQAVNSGTAEGIDAFDGVVVYNSPATKSGQPSSVDWEFFGPHRFEREDIASTITTLDHINYQSFTGNFLRFNVSTNPGSGADWFDDFDNILHNVSLWAQVAKETGHTGWMFDLEDYNNPPAVFYYPNMAQAGSKTFEEYAAQVRLRGSQVMQAIQQEYPDITLLMSVSHSYVHRTDPTGANLEHINYGLLPAFVDGLIEAAGPQVTLIDGQEQAYGYLSAADYDNGLRVIREDALSLVAPELHEKYRQTVKAGAAVYANYIFNQPLSDKQKLHLLESNVYNAMRTADDYAWLYSEQMSFWESGYPIPTPDGAVEAIRSARLHARPMATTLLEDDFNGASGAAVDAGQWDASSQAAVHLDGTGKLRLDGDAGIARLIGASTDAWVIPTDESSTRLLVEGLNHTAGGYSSVGLATDATGQTQIMLRTDPSQTVWYLRIVSDGDVAEYLTDIAMHTSDGDWVIDWAADRVLVWYNNEVKVDTSIDPADYSEGAGLHLPEVALTAYAEKWGGSSLTIDSVRLGVIPEPASILFMSVSAMVLLRRCRV